MTLLLAAGWVAALWLVQLYALPSGIGLPLILFVTMLLSLWAFGRQLYVAIRTGRLLGRGVVYASRENPFMYWLGVTFFSCVVGGPAFGAFAALVAAWVVD